MFCYAARGHDMNCSRVAIELDGEGHAMTYPQDTMQPVEPYDHITLLERLLRDLVTSELPNWLSQLGDEARAELEAKREVERKKRRGIRHSERLIDYTDFTQIQNMILKNYATFEPALGSREYVKVYFKRIDAFRNPAMHTRPILGFERQLIEGIVGEFRQQIALFRTMKDPALDNYPHIEVVTDNFGRSRNKPDPGSMDDKVRLQVGDIIEFQCRGEDPQDRELTWWVREQHDSDPPRDTAIGSTVTLRMEVLERDVMEFVYVLVYLKSNGRYHAQTGSDDAVAFVYAVDPPDGPPNPLPSFAWTGCSSCRSSSPPEQHSEVLC